MSSQLQHEADYESTIRGFLYRQFMRHPKSLPAGTDLSSQTAIVTGSNSGLGLEAGRQLLHLGLSHLILAVRSQPKGDKAAEGLREAFPGAQVSVWLLDMTSYASITAFVEQCKSLPAIHMIILNAGLAGNSFFETIGETGHETSLQVNYISTALLTVLLLPVLRSKRVVGSKPPVLSIVGSDSAYWGSIEAQGPILARFDRPEGYGSMTWYTRTKLLQIIFLTKLVEEIGGGDDKDVVVNIVNPGLTQTNFGGDRPGSSKVVAFAIHLFKKTIARTVPVGASTYVDAVVAKGVESHGSFVSDWEIRPYPAFVYTEEGARVRERLWEETMEELHFAGASDIIQRMKN